METESIKLYSAEEARAVKKKRIVWNAVSFLVLAAALSLCAAFCASAYKTETFEMLPYAIVSSIAGGFVYLTLRIFVVADLKAAAEHIEAILTGEAETVDGSFELTDERLFIKKGVAMTKVTVSDNDRVRSLQIYDKKKKLFDAGRAVRVKAVYGFITEYEVEI